MIINKVKIMLLYHYKENDVFHVDGTTIFLF